MSGSGRIDVEAGANSVVLRLGQWHSGPQAVLGVEEARVLVERIQAVLAKLEQSNANA